jgi:hypothetical protein
MPTVSGSRAVGGVLGRPKKWHRVCDVEGHSLRARYGANRRGVPSNRAVVDVSVSRDALTPFMALWLKPKVWCPSWRWIMRHDTTTVCCAEYSLGIRFSTNRNRGKVPK